MDKLSLAKIWNKSLVSSRVDRPYEPRTHIWASELAQSFYDRFYKMQGRKPSTPPNLRSQRKFQAGNLTEFLVKQILERAGLLKETQTHITNSEFALPVTGKLDFLAGGHINDIDAHDFPEGFDNVAYSVVEQLSNLHPNGLRDQILEIKSCSGMMFNAYEKKPALHHMLQCFHYAHAYNVPGTVIYISRDDLRIVEHTLMPDSEQWLKLYREDIARMAVILQMEQPPLEPLLLLNDGRYKKNWHVEYSNYLEDYGFKQPQEYADIAGKLCGRLNRVMKRKEEGKKLTEKNLQALDDGAMFCQTIR